MRNNEGANEGGEQRMQQEGIAKGEEEEKDHADKQQLQRKQ